MKPRDTSSELDNSAVAREPGTDSRISGVVPIAQREAAVASDISALGEPLNVHTAPTPVPPPPPEPVHVHVPRSSKPALTRGVELPPAPTRAPAALAASSAPPTASAPPPRKSRRPDQPPEHEAFQLRRATSPRKSRAPGRPSSSPLPTQPASASGSVMLPPPPGPADLKPEPPQPAAPVLRKPARSNAKPARSTPRFDELPSVDPFEPFRGMRRRNTEPWLFVIVVALAIVGVVALGAVALGYIGKIGW